MDSALCDSMKNANVPTGTKVFNWYNIFCQWRIHLMEQIAVSGRTLTLPQDVDIDGGIGLFHMHGHADQCFHWYASYFVPGAAIVDREVLETLWSVLNQVSRFTRTATLLHREEVLDNHMNDNNWRKIVNISMFVSTLSIEVLLCSAKHLTAKYRKALEQAEDTCKYFEQLSHSAPPGKIAEWRSKIEIVEQARMPFNAKSMDYLKSPQSKHMCNGYHFRTCH